MLIYGGQARVWSRVTCYGGMKKENKIVQDVSDGRTRKVTGMEEIFNEGISLLCEHQILRTNMHGSH